MATKKKKTPAKAEPKAEPAKAEPKAEPAKAEPKAEPAKAFEWPEHVIARKICPASECDHVLSRLRSRRGDLGQGWRKVAEREGVAYLVQDAPGLVQTPKPRSKPRGVER